METEWPYAKEWIASVRIIIRAHWDEPVTDAQVVDFATQNLSRSHLTKVLEALKETA